MALRDTETIEANRANDKELKLISLAGGEKEWRLERKISVSCVLMTIWERDFNAICEMQRETFFLSVFCYVICSSHNLLLLLSLLLL